MSLFNWGDKKLKEVKPEMPTQPEHTEEVLDAEYQVNNPQEFAEEDFAQEEEEPVVVSKNQLVPAQKKNQVAVRQEEPKGNSLVIHRGSQVARRTGQALVQVRPKAITIGGQKVPVDPYQLMRIIKRLTQNIGEYKESETPHAKYIVTALRKCRGDAVSDLEHHFHIHWQIDEETGQSVFYM